MKTRLAMIMLAAISLAAGCSIKEERPLSDGAQIILTASLEGSGTKTTVQDGGTQVYWEPADEIKVFFKNNSGRFISMNTEQSAVADFTGALNIVVGSNEGAGSSNVMWGLYPYRSDATSDGESVTTTLPSEQTVRAGSFAKDTHITLARAQANSYDLAFYNVCGGLRFSLTQEGIKSVTFEGNNGETLAGTIKLAFENGVPAIKEATDPQTAITLSAPNGGTFETGKWYYIEALPGTLSSGYKMTFHKNGESAKLTSSSPVSFKRGKYGSLADADEGLIFKPDGEGGEEPDPEDIIQFADSIAKYACIEKFDADGDGEISYAEAAAATDLNGLFNDWKTVTSFDELQYFTSATSISGVFTGLTKLESVIVPDNVTDLGSNTFKGCTSLKSVKLPSGLTAVPNYCFSGCSALENVVLPSVLASVSDYCFRGCTSLTTLKLPATVQTVKPYAFDGCSALNNVNMPSGLASIDTYAFRECTSIASVSLPSALTGIGTYAFSGCSSLKSVSLPSGVKSIPDYCFSGCLSLASVSLSPATTSIGQYAFQDCTSLTDIAFPIGLESIGTYAFTGCKSLESVVLPDCSLGSYVFRGCSSLKSVSLGDGAKCADYALSDCLSLESVVLPSDMTKTPVGLFKNCTALAHITWPDALTDIGNYTFEGCWPYGGILGDSTMELPASVKSIGYMAFGYVSHLIVPSTGFVNIGDYTFSDFTNIYVPSSMVEIYKVRTGWSRIADNIFPIDSYPQPSKSIAVDLGLQSGLKWADRNVNGQFAWGETETKESYSWGDYKWSYTSSITLKKYNTSSSYGTVDNKTVLDPEDDAAHVNWGGSWRMPTDAEWTELIKKCTWTWTTQNGEKGYLVTSNTNGNSIFLPADGYRSFKFHDDDGAYGYYWSSSLYTGNSKCALYVVFYSDGVDRRNRDRHYGYSVRPVLE